MIISDHITSNDRWRSRYAHTKSSTVPSLRGAESAVAVRHDADHIRHHISADHFPALARFGGWNRGWMFDLDHHISAAAVAEGATAGVRVKWIMDWNGHL